MNNKQFLLLLLIPYSLIAYFFIVSEYVPDSLRRTFFLHYTLLMRSFNSRSTVSSEIMGKSSKTSCSVKIRSPAQTRQFLSAAR